MLQRTLSTVLVSSDCLGTIAFCHEICLHVVQDEQRDEEETKLNRGCGRIWRLEVSPLYCSTDCTVTSPVSGKGAWTHATHLLKCSLLMDRPSNNICSSGVAVFVRLLGARNVHPNLPNTRMFRGSEPQFCAPGWGQI